MMKRSFRDAWTMKLRSGEFVQARHTLAEEDREDCRCCLGVAYAVNTERVPRGVFPSEGILDQWGLGYGTADYLAQMNDTDRKSFAQIADYIDTLPVEEG